MGAPETEAQKALELVYAHYVLVPIANPVNAEALLRLGASLADPEDGVVLALHVVVAGADSDAVAELPDDLAQIVQELIEEGLRVKPTSIRASNPERGILDAAREEGADLIVLGYHGGNSESVMGPVVEAVARTAQSDLVVYRGETNIKVKRILIPADGGANSRVAARLGMVLSESYHAPMTALYVQEGMAEGRWHGLQVIGATLAELPNANAVEQKVIRATDVALGILGEAGPHDLVLFGFAQHSPFERWLYGSVAQRILKYAPGPVILSKSSEVALEPSLRNRVERWVAGLSPRLTPNEREGVRQQALDMARPSVNFFVLVILSSIIASFGLLQNSVAVIIGAMLVAPLMAPLLAFSIGLVIGELRLMQKAATNVGKGMLLSLVIAVVVGVITPFGGMTTEMSFRTQPTILDLFVALASGAAAAYAIARKDVPAALTGVAIAAALMPPLCTVGLLIAYGRLPLALGALQLFLLNIVSIALAGAGIFLWLGITPGLGKVALQSVGQRLAFLAIVLVLLAVPLGIGLWQVVATEAENRAIQDALSREDIDAVQWELVSVEVDRDYEGALRVVATVRTWGSYRARRWAGLRK
ncbi:MAG: TIGR00341 family protein [Anaerolineae bacterium]|nr:TIGR00341 family protein [Anaerolineae bacterium]